MYVLLFINTNIFSNFLSTSLRGMCDEAIPDKQSGYASSTPSYSPCTVWDCFVPRNDGK